MKKAFDFLLGLSFFMSIFEVNSTMRNKAVFIDAGHGAYHNGAYHCLAGGKLFEHKGSGENFHNGEIFYEGVSNRNLAKHIETILKQAGFNVYGEGVIYHKWKDNSLWHRVNVANAIYRSMGYDDALFICNHSNASSTHTARGLEVFTSPNHTDSDIAAEILIDQCRTKMAPYFAKFRTDGSDGDQDKESRLYTLMYTKMYAIYPEWNFFDNLEDAKILKSKDFVQGVQDVVLNTVQNFFNR